MDRFDKCEGDVILHAARKHADDVQAESDGEYTRKKAHDHRSQSVEWLLTYCNRTGPALARYRAERDGE